MTKADFDLLEFLEPNNFKIAHTSTLIELFYGGVYRTGTKRLKALVNSKLIKRERSGFGCEFVYYKVKPKNIRHALLRTDFYRELHKVAQIKRFKAESKIGGMVADGAIDFTVNGKSRWALLEVEISHKGFDAEKYRKVEWEKLKVTTKPDIIVVSDREVNLPGYRVIMVDTALQKISL